VALRPWDLNVRHLRVFLTVVEQEGVTNASRHLHITQPAVSKVIRSLESMAGGVLFTRVRRRLVLTPVGEAFHRHAVAALAELQAGAMELDALRADGAELIRVNGIQTIMSALVPRAIERLRRKRPKVQVVLTGEAWYGIADILKGVVKGDADIGITVFQEELGLDVLTADPLFGDRFCALARRDHPLAQKERVDIRDLMDDLVVLPPLESIAGRIMVQEFSAAGLPFPPQRMLAANRHVTLGVVKECNAIAFVATHPALEEFRSDEFALLNIPFRQPVPWTISICRRRNSIASPVELDFIACLKDLVAEAEENEARTEDGSRRDFLAPKP
jgi:DNA-binding transcriptional LysR family regulator